LKFKIEIREAVDGYNNKKNSSTIAKSIIRKNVHSPFQSQETISLTRQIQSKKEQHGYKPLLKKLSA
jgi:hypothetical protein